MTGARRAVRALLPALAAMAALLPATAARAAVDTTLPDPTPGFETVGDLSRKIVNGPGRLLPLVGDGSACRPLRSACVDPATSLVLIRARDHEIVWEPTGPPDRGLLFDPGAGDGDTELTIAAVGRPRNPEPAATYLLPVLDPQGIVPVRLLAMAPVDGRFRPTAGAPPYFRPRLAPVDFPSGQGQPPVRQPFGRPELADAGDVALEDPLVLGFAGTEPEPLFGLVLAGTGGGPAALVPLVGPDDLPRLVRTGDSASSIFVPLPQEEAPRAAPEEARFGRRELAAFGALAVGNAGLAAWALLRRLRRRRRLPARAGATTSRARRRGRSRRSRS